jgi:hypothetical protein
MIPDDWSSTVTHQEYWEQVDIYADFGIDAAKQDTSKLAQLIELLPTLPSPARERILAYLGSDTMTSIPEPARERVWSELVDLVSKHRKFADAEWAMNPNLVNEIAALAERLQPLAPVFRNQRLFSEREFDLYERKGNYHEQARDLEKRRQVAVAEIIEYGGANALIEFAKAVESPWRVGFSAGWIADKDIDEAVLPVLLESENKALAQFVGGFVWGRFRSGGWPWIENINMSMWSISQKGQLLAYLPFTIDTWPRLPKALGPDESAYWTKANVNPYDAEEGLEIAIDRLVEHGRPHAAIRCLKKILDDEQPVDSQQAIRVLKAVLSSSEQGHAMSPDAIVKVIEHLQKNSDVISDDLIQLEWAFLPLLDRRHGSAPKMLQQRLADDAKFFCDVIRLLYRSDREKSTGEDATEQQEDVAKKAYRLISRWRTPPGTRRDGTFSGDELSVWLDEVKSICASSGHLDVALSRLGHVLAYAPADPDSLWLHRSVATALNAKDAEDMRKGFTIELFNRRGVHSWTAGKEERELAEKYRNQAEQVESAGYHRVATALRKLAASYDREAEQDAASDPFER